MKFELLESGTVFGKLKVLSIINKPTSSGYKYNVLCECGNKTIVFGRNLKKGHTKSCGCFRSENMYVHGKSRSKAYRAWVSIIHRCLNKKCRSYKDYGARGITVSDESVFAKCEYCKNPVDGHLAENYKEIDVFCSLKCNQEYMGD